MTHHKIILGDCLEGMKLLDDGSVDLVVTSPPYNVGMDYGESANDQRPYEEYLDWLDVVWNECYRVLRSGARICININDTGRNPYYPVHCDIASRMRKKWYLMGIVVWDKTNCMSNTAWGSWMSPTAPSLRGLQEYIIIAGKGGKVFRKENAETDVWTKKDFLDYTKEIWRFTPEVNRNHPAPYPAELPKRCIKLYTYLGDVILDPFAGSFTTTIVARDSGRNSISMEINPDYWYNIGETRLKANIPTLDNSHTFEIINLQGEST